MVNGDVPAILRLINLLFVSVDHERTGPDFRKTENASHTSVTMPEPKAADRASDEASQKLCELCEEERVNVKFLPCGHEVLCSLCAFRAVKCLVCKVCASIYS